MLHRPIGPELVETAREGLAREGCAVLKGFLNPALDQIQGEARTLAPKAYAKKRYTNPYSSADDPNLPSDHPARMFLERTNAFVAGDLIPEETALKKLYRSDAFKSFIAECVDEPEIFEYSDPLAGLVINVLEPSWTHPWHFDTNEFIVSTLVDTPEGGGLFEYCPNIRSPEAENFDAVGRVLRDEDRGPVKTLRLEPGDIQIFYGRYSLHRVTPVEGSQPRLTAIFAYAKEPGVIGRLERTRYLFGRTTPAHEAAAERRADALMD